MPVPLNAIAETVAKLQIEVETANINIAYHQQQLAATEATIAELEPLAEWGPDPVEPAVFTEVDPTA